MGESSFMIQINIILFLLAETIIKLCRHSLNFMSMAVTDVNTQVIFSESSGDSSVFTNSWIFLFSIFVSNIWFFLRTSPLTRSLFYSLIHPFTWIHPLSNLNKRTIQNLPKIIKKIIIIFLHNFHEFWIISVSLNCYCCFSFLKVFLQANLSSAWWHLPFQIYGIYVYLLCNPFTNLPPHLNQIDLCKNMKNHIWDFPLHTHPTRHNCLTKILHTLNLLNLWNSIAAWCFFGLKRSSLLS